MFGQCRGPVEAFPAFHAAVRFDLLVNLLVVLQSLFLCKALAAGVTGKWLDLGVDLLVPVQHRLGGVRLATDGAGVRLFPRVAPAVFHEVGAAVEALATVEAGERPLPRVSPHVVDELRIADIGLAALRAREWPLARVGLFVADDARAQCEALAAY